MDINKTIRTLCFFAVAWLSAPSHAFNTITVTVSVNSAQVPSGCWDAWCAKPDQYVAFYGAGNAAMPFCKSASVVDRAYVNAPAPADWSCTATVVRPDKLYIGLYDGDGPNDDNTVGQPIDVWPGPEKAVAIDLEYLVQQPGASFTYTTSGDDGSITFTVSARITPGELTGFTVTENSFRPSTGEQIVFTALATGAPYTVLHVNAVNSAGVQVWNLFGYLDDPGETGHQFVWQGRDENGHPLPPGQYRVTFQAFESTSNLPAPGTFVQNIMIVSPPALPSLGLLGTTPALRWAPEVGDLKINVVSNGVTRVSGEVFPNASCTGQKLMDLAPVTVAPLQPGALTWSGPAPGTPSQGTFGIKVTGTSNGGPTSPGSVCQSIDLIAAPPAILNVQHFPFLAEPGQTVDLNARSMDARGAPRVVARLDVFGSVQSVPGTAPAPPTAPLKTCFMASACTARITLPAGGSFFSWQATAADRAGTIATHGWRGQRVVDAGTFAQSASLSLPTDVALNGPLMSDLRDVAHSLDLVFAVSTEFDWNNPTDRQTIGAALDGFMTRLWGMAGAGAPAPTTFLARPDLVRLYVISEQRTVRTTPKPNLCDWSVPGVAWADAIGILHRQSCRNNATPWNRSFSATLTSPDTIFHELHHALFGLADEYESGDGGYFEEHPFPNIYNNLSDCLAVVGREPNGCGPITQIDIVTRMATGVTFFRLDDSVPDVMWEGGTQRFGDIRRINWKEGLCDAGGC
jgi:hypothetical protein